MKDAQSPGPFYPSSSDTRSVTSSDTRSFTRYYMNFTLQLALGRKSRFDFQLFQAKAARLNAGAIEKESQAYQTKQAKQACQEQRKAGPE